MLSEKIDKGIYARNAFKGVLTSFILITIHNMYKTANFFYNKEKIDIKYFIEKREEKEEFTLFLAGGPGQDPFKYKDTVFKDKNILIIQYRDILEEEYNNTNLLLKDIIDIVKIEKIKIKNIVGFSFGSYLSNYLIKSLRPDNIINVGFLFKFFQLEDAYMKGELHGSDMKRFYNKLLDLNLTESNKYEFCRENLKLMGYSNVKITEEDLERQELELFYEKNRYFEAIIEEKYRYKEEDLDTVNTYIFSGLSDNCTPSTNKKEFIRRFNLQLSINELELDCWHSLSAFKEEILNLI